MGFGLICKHHAKPFHTFASSLQVPQYHGQRAKTRLGVWQTSLLAGKIEWVYLSAETRTY